MSTLVQLRLFTLSFLEALAFLHSAQQWGKYCNNYAINKNKISQSIRIKKTFQFSHSSHCVFFFIFQFTIFSLYSGSYLLNLTSLHHIQQKRSSCKQQEDSHFSGRFFQQQSLVHFFQSKHRKPQQLLLLWWRRPVST